jgi:hypothetical protein
MQRDALKCIAAILQNHLLLLNLFPVPPPDRNYSHAHILTIMLHRAREAYHRTQAQSSSHSQCISQECHHTIARAHSPSNGRIALRFGSRRSGDSRDIETNTRANPAVFDRAAMCSIVSLYASNSPMHSMRALTCFRSLSRRSTGRFRNCRA